MTDRPTRFAVPSEVRFALVLAALQIGGALALTASRVAGLIDGDLATRGVMVLIGLGLAAVGNRMPKQFEGPEPESVGVAATRQAVQRVGGWSMFLGGLVYAAVWAFAPRELALVGCVVAVLAAVGVMGAHAAWRMRGVAADPR